MDFRKDEKYYGTLQKLRGRPEATVRKATDPAPAATGREKGAALSAGRAEPGRRPASLERGQPSEQNVLES